MLTIISTVLSLVLCITPIFGVDTPDTNIPLECPQTMVEFNEIVEPEDEENQECDFSTKLEVLPSKGINGKIKLPPRIIRIPVIKIPIPGIPRIPRYPIYPFSNDNLEITTNTIVIEQTNIN
jgi:hypothetical protein